MENPPTSTTSRSRRLFGTAALGLALLTGGAVAVPAMASAQDADPTPTVTVDGESNERSERGRRGHKGCNDNETLAEVLGVTVEDLRTARENDQSIADVAVANGVDVQTVIDALVEAKQDRLDAKVADDRLTAEEAADKAADIEEQITDKVNAIPSERSRNGS